MRSSILLALLFAVAACTPACGEKQDPFAGKDIGVDAGSDGDSDGQLDTDEDETVTYTNHIAAILNANCTSCHDSGKSGPQRNNAPLGVDFDSYDAAKASAQRANVRIQAGTMPPSAALSLDDKALFQAWIDQGTPE